MGHSGQRVPEVAIIEVTRSKQEAPGTLGWLIDKVYCTHTWMKDQKKKKKEKMTFEMLQMWNTQIKFLVV